MKNKQIRRIIVLIMCLVFVFNLAVSAYALSAGGAWSSVSLPAEVGVSSAMNGLGVLPGESPDAYNGTLGRCVNYLTEQGYVVAGKIDAWKRDQVEGTPWQYGFDVSLIDVIRAWLFNDDQAVVARPLSYSALYNQGPYTREQAISMAQKAPAAFAGRGGQPAQDAIIAVFSGNYELTPDGTLFLRDSSYLRWVTVNNEGTGYFLSSTITSYFPAYSLGSNPPVSTSEDLTLGLISAPSFPLAESYPIWHSNSIVIPGSVAGGTETDDDVIVYPIAPGNTVEDTQSKTQEEVWAGDATITDSPAIPETATLADILSAILSIPQSIVSSISQALSNFFGISGTADAYAISLTDFFPFCIPFDIYDFLSVLSAEPEAPVFHWEIPVPQLGRTFDIDVDLSPWDPVAAVFRTFELLAFIVGLGMVTREKFLRS